MNAPTLTAATVKAEAARLGFSACGIAPAAVVDDAECRRYETWLHDGCHASMGYLENHLDKRFNPCLLVEGTRSIVSVALNYFPARRLAPSQYQFAWYAYGKDYHDVMRARLRTFLQRLQALSSAVQGRAFCDTAPVLEHYWARRAGLGWTGKHTQLVIPELGSCFVLGELFLNVELETDAPVADGCGACEKCLQACPTHALDGVRHLDARRCLSYLTIENRGEIPPEFASKMGTCIYGCDRCQMACPHNRHACPTTVPEFAPSEEFMQMTPEAWHALNSEQYTRLFKGSAVKRAKFEGLTRNISSVQLKICD